MKISKASELLVSVIKHNIENPGRDAQIVPYVVGDPGLGKTSLARQAAKKAEIPIQTLIVAQYDAGELGGFPFPDGDTMRRLRPDFLPRAEVHGEHGLLFLDELPQAPVANQNICSQMVNEWRVGEHRIPPGWTIAAAGNLQTNRAGTNRMPSHLRDRLLFIEVQADPQDWQGWYAGVAGRPEVSAFIGFRPDWLHKFDPDQEVFPSPRSWEKVGMLLDMGLDPVIEREALTGTVGKGGAADFAAFLKIYRELPDINVIWQNPKSAPIPKDQQTLYALCGALSYHCKDRKQLSALIEYIGRFERQDMGFFTMYQLRTRNMQLAQMAEYTKWLAVSGAQFF